METTDQNTLKLELIEKYIDFIRETKNEDENYKWDAINHFRKTWDIEALDFGTMVADAFSKHYNLFYHSSWWFLKITAENETDEAREMFRQLFDERIDLKNRMQDFRSKSEILLAKIRLEMGRDNLQHGQDERTISVYLAFQNPEKYYLYKDSVYRDYCKYIGEKLKPAGEKYQHFTELADSFKNDYLLKDQELLQLHKELHPNLGWDDSNLITQNLLYRMLFDKAEEEYPNRTIKQWLEKFANAADDWFKKYEIIENRHKFFCEFKKKENIQKADWEYFQQLGNHLNTFQSIALAKTRALGNINAAKGSSNDFLENYRENFIDLIYGEDSIDLRIDRFIQNVPYFSDSSVSELVGQFFPEKYVFFNSKDKEGIKCLGIKTDFKKGLSFGQKFLEFNKTIEPLIKMYEEVVGQRTNTTIPLEVDQFLWYISLQGKPEIEKPHLPIDGKNYWLYAPGENAKYWDEFYEAGIMALGWDKLGDLEQYKSKEEITESLKKLYNIEGSRKNDATANYEFKWKITAGDIIIAKRGTSEYLGYGVVSSDYYYDDKRTVFQKCRKVEWKKKGHWPEETGPIVVKTLTDITKYPDYVEKLKKLIGIDQMETTGIVEEPETQYNPANTNYYWLNANPKMWSLNDLEIKPEIDYTTHTETGTKRRIYKYMQAVKPGDKVIGYETSPVKKVRALMEVTKSIYENEAGQEVFDMKLVAFTPQQPTWDDLKALPALQNSEVIQNMQGSLFKLTKEEYEAIVILTKTKLRFDYYSKEDLLKDVFIAPEKLDRTLALLQRKKNIILQGPPGTGKTYFAKRLAWCMMGEKDPTRVRTIQFHQSYSYEDFIQGYRPEGGGLKLKNGVFYDFAKQASRDKDRDYVMIIDEINRGNLSKIFGELMLLIEADKRDQKIKLAYSRDEEEFSVPPNLHIIGTMNTADRSLALVDYALRRRFAFISMTPHFENHFVDHLNYLGFEASFVKNLIDKINHINGLIMGDSSLKEGFLVGHSYFVTSEIPADPDQWLMDIFNYEILPLLEEYWFDDQDRLSDIRTILGLSK